MRGKKRKLVDTLQYALSIAAADLITYLELLFDSDDRVDYITNDVWQDQYAEGKWMPRHGVYDRTGGELITGYCAADTRC